MFPDNDHLFGSVSVQSDVSDQPMTDTETLRGAKNRARNAADVVPQADFYVGIEGGISNNGNDMDAFAWVYILSRDQCGKAKTAVFSLPPKLIRLIQNGYELGDADDMVFKRQNSKQDNGAVGILTGNVLDRSAYYEQAVILALIPFKNIKLYSDRQSGS